MSVVQPVIVFALALTILLFSAKFFTNSAEKIGRWLGFPAFVIGVFIVGIGTSLPEFISGMISVKQGVSEILSGNISGSNISNLLLVTGLAIALNRKHIQLGSSYIYIDLHFLIGSVFIFILFVYDGLITFSEAWIGILAFIVYSIYLIKDAGTTEMPEAGRESRQKTPWAFFLLLIVSALGIFAGAHYTIQSITEIAAAFQVPNTVIALTLLSLGTTLPELAVNMAAIRQGKAEIAIGNVLGSCIFNTLVIPGAASLFGPVAVPQGLLVFAIPVMAGAALLFYLLAQDKRISPWEGWLLVMIYVVFMVKIAGG